ncbi:hypothetical protein Rhow_000823 [Rhodococcus wratislaviensis]|uniref:Uncharacterized protein n=1 Tax=Rhodococcus wratislaviensis TaxID=44752 RepID=A0A402C2Y0_RHOWR|nr:hypothetical protein Rhow_000823 [Rhodococcus wratislaviensis]
MRLYRHRRGPVFPTIERYFVVAPALAADKEHDNFNQWWAGALAAAAGVLAAV